MKTFKLLTTIAILAFVSFSCGNGDLEDRVSKLEDTNSTFYSSEGFVSLMQKMYDTMSTEDKVKLENATKEIDQINGEIATAEKKAEILAKKADDTSDELEKAEAALTALEKLSADTDADLQLK